MFGCTTIHGSAFAEDRINMDYNIYDYRPNLGAMSTTSSPYSQSSMDSPESSQMSTSPALSPDTLHNLLVLSPDEQLSANIAALSTAQQGVPYLEMVQQPVEKFRFRYRSEMMGAHGSLLARSAAKLRRKVYPSVKLCNYSGPAMIRCSLYSAQSDESLRSPHAHRLVVRQGNDDVDDPHCETVDQSVGYTATFQGMGIIHMAKKNIPDELIRKKQERLLEEQRMRNINIQQLSTADETRIRAEAEFETKTMNLNVVTLCFECLVMTNAGIYAPLCNPIFSQPINNMKSALTGELKICRIDRVVSSCLGNEEVYLLVEKVGKKNIQVRFFELDDDDNEVWSANGKFNELDVHHQFAIVLRTPPYRNPHITETVDVFVDLYRPSDGDRSEPIRFKYKPSDKTLCLGRKRARRGSVDTDVGPVADPMLSYVEVDIEDSFPSASSLLRGIEAFNSEEFNNCFTEIKENGMTPSEEAVWTLGDDLAMLHDLDLATDGPSGPRTKPRTVAGQHGPADSDKLLMKVGDRLRKLDSGSGSLNQVRDLFNERTEDGDSALHLAVVHPNKTHLRLMLNTLCRGTLRDVLDLTNHSEETALHLAALTDQDSAMLALLNGGADCDRVNEDGDTALHLSVKHAHQRCLRVLTKHKCCTAITREAKNEQGWSALHLSVLHDNMSAMKRLLTAGCEVNALDKSGARTVLHLAVEESRPEMVRYLLSETEVSVNMQDRNGNTALHVGVVRGCGEVVEAIMRAGADPLIANFSTVEADDVKTEALTALDLAAGRPEMLELILSSISAQPVEHLQVKTEPNTDDNDSGVYFDKATLSSLCRILDANRGWLDLATLLDLDYLLASLETSNSPTKMLLNYADVFGSLSVARIRGILTTLNQSEAVECIDLMLAKLLVEV